MLAAQGSYGDCDDGRLDDGRAEREEPDFPFGLGVHIAQRSHAWIVPQLISPCYRYGTPAPIASAAGGRSRNASRRRPLVRGP